IDSSTSRNLLLLAGEWESLHVDFVTARFAGDIRDPVAVGREGGIDLFELRFQIREWFTVPFPISILRRDPQIASSLGARLLIHHELPVLRPVVSPAVGSSHLDENLLIAGAACSTDIEVVGATPH